MSMQDILTKAPTIRNTFSNSRENHAIVGDKSGIEHHRRKNHLF